MKIILEKVNFIQELFINKWHSKVFCHYDCNFLIFKILKKSLRLRKNECSSNYLVDGVFFHDLFQK